jgi:hypothetical protein
MNTRLWIKSGRLALLPLMAAASLMMAHGAMAQTDTAAPAEKPVGRIVGPTQVKPGEQFTLDGATSTGSGGALTYLWMISPPTMRDQSGGNSQGSKVVLTAPAAGGTVSAKLTVYVRDQKTMSDPIVYKVDVKD